MKTLAPPLKWHGGKHYLTPHFLALMPPHLHYVEPYFGGGQVLFAQPLPRQPGLEKWSIGSASGGCEPA
jgi:DNA adenine methylase